MSVINQAVDTFDFEIRESSSGAVRFTANLALSLKGERYGVQLGGAIELAVRSRAVLRGADLRHAVLSGAVLRGADLSSVDLRDAVLSGAVLRGADQRGVVLSGAILLGAVLRGVDLSRVDLRDADLRGVDLSGADLRGAVLSGVDLRDADLSSVDLRGADLRGADLRGVVLRSAVLNGADLRGADLSDVRNDFWDVLRQAQPEVPALLSTLRDGRINGSTYKGPCACLVGTIANARGVDYYDLRFADSQRPIERWFLAIHPGHTPENSEVAKITEGWIVEFQNQTNN